MMKLHNTLTRKVEDFLPQNPQKVLLYTCGPTVYDYLHIGNWTAYIYWDILVRILQSNGYSVDRVMNITDVGHLTSDKDEGEDKLEKGARRENKTAWEIAEFYTENCLEDMRKLGLITPTHIAKATDFIPQQLELVQTLKQKGYTYQIDDGIYFDTSKFPTYANFAHLNLAKLRAGARVEQNPQKRNVSDFALWKFTPKNTRRDMEWDTPEDLLESKEKRKGFPGWHLECSAIAMTLLGETLDIHTGGIDHIPVHHTNEIAQSEAATDKVFSNYWLHNNHLKADGTKISKSLGNGYTLHDIQAKGYSLLDFKMFVLQSHYRTESNFTWDNLDSAKVRLQHWREIACLRLQTKSQPENSSEIIESYRASLVRAAQGVTEAVSEDLNTPAALQIVDEAFSIVSENPLGRVCRDALTTLLTIIDSLLGLELEGSAADISDQQKQLIEEREVARQNKDWAKSDIIRDELLKQAIHLNDTPDGTVWYRS